MKSILTYKLDPTVDMMHIAHDQVQVAHGAYPLFAAPDAKHEVGAPTITADIPLEEWYIRYGTSGKRSRQICQTIVGESYYSNVT